MNMDEQLTQILKAHLCKPKKNNNINNDKSNTLHSILASQLKKQTKSTSAPTSPSPGKSSKKKQNVIDKTERNLKRAKSFRIDHTSSNSKPNRKSTNSPTSIQESLYRTSKQLEISTATMNTTALSPGLPNIGNSCYANAILQVLFSLPPFTYQLHYNHVKDKNSLIDHLDSPRKKLDFNSNSNSPIKNSGRPSNIISILKTLLNLRSCPSSLNLKQRHSMTEIILKHGGGQNFSFGQQQDSHEFCMALLDKLSCSDTRGYAATDDNPDNSVLKQPFNRWFAYNVASERNCMNCDNCKVEIQPSRELKIPLNSNNNSRTSSCDSNMIIKSVRSSSRHSKKKRYTDEGLSYFENNAEIFEQINGIPDSPAASSTSTTPVTVKTQDMIDSCLDDKFGIDWTCDKCNFFNQSSVRKMRITSLPVVLVVVLQRFMFDSKTCNLQKLNNNIKIDHEISINKLLDLKETHHNMPLNEVKQKYFEDYQANTNNDDAIKNNKDENADMYYQEFGKLDTNYKLMAVVDHIGVNAVDGHYTTTCLEPKQTLINHTPGIEAEIKANQDNLVWTEYDDLIVKPYRQNAKSFPDESTTAYMLFYRWFYKLLEHKHSI